MGPSPAAAVCRLRWTRALGSARGRSRRRVLEIPAARAFLTRVNGEVVALSEKCTHLGCGVPFCDSSGQFECPCHGSVFSRGGDYLTGPAPRGMDRYPVDEEDGLLYINTGERIDGLAPGQLTVDEPARGPACAGETHG